MDPSARFAQMSNQDMQAIAAQQAAPQPDQALGAADPRLLALMKSAAPPQGPQQSFANQAAAGLGNAAVAASQGVMQGVKELGQQVNLLGHDAANYMGIGDPNATAELRKTYAEQQRQAANTDFAKNDPGIFKFANYATQLIGESLAASALIPAAEAGAGIGASMLSTGAQGALMGAFQDPGQDGSRINAAATTGLLSGGLVGATSAVAKGLNFLRPVANQEAVNMFEKAGVKPRLSQVVDDPNTQKLAISTEKSLGWLPLTSIKHNAASQKAQLTATLKSIAAQADNQIANKEAAYSTLDTMISQAKNTEVTAPLTNLQAALADVNSDPKIAVLAKKTINPETGQAIDQLSSKFKNQINILSQLDPQTFQQAAVQRKVLDSVINTMKADPAANTQIERNALFDVRAGLEKDVEALADKSGNLQAYRKAKTAYQQYISAEALSEAFQKNLANNAYEPRLIKSAFQTAINQGRISPQDLPTIKAVTYVMQQLRDSVLKPHYGINASHVVTGAGALAAIGGTSMLANDDDTKTAVTGTTIALGSIAAGLGLALTTPIGVKLLTKAAASNMVGPSGTHALQVISRLGAGAIAIHNSTGQARPLTQADFAKMSNEDLQKFIKEKERQQ